ncbi:maleylpyruvate isomerase N-terminal domain-containing protein [Isoptericola sp. NPDC057191]|uniref:maleylpyruvate isomerase N-terminal domain-containing protein n=1 Tax=Isoptericola sp. NPDC057191 TaxID=3346041 RepID=UPI0036349B61
MREPTAAPSRPDVDPRTGRRTDGGPEPDRLALLATLQHEFAAAAADADLDARVPACGDWRARDLVLHLAGVHHWAAGMAVGDPTRSEDLPEPAGGAPGLAALYRRHATALRVTLDAAGLDGAARTLLGDGPASFWWRRQVHETLVHLHDLHAARAGSATAALGDVAVEATVWGDAVDEVITMFQPRQVHLGRMAPPADAVRVEATDLGWSWLLGAPEADAAAAVRGPAHGLALLLWGRLTAEEAGIVVDGDAAAARRLLDAPLVP